jgi:hypothetical protein
LDIQSIVAQLKSEMIKIGEVIGLLEADAPIKKRRGRPPESAAAKSQSGRGGSLTPAGRPKLLKSVKRRREPGDYQTANLSPAPPAKPKKRGGMSAAGRKNISEAMKKRWADKRQKTS